MSRRKKHYKNSLYWLSEEPERADAGRVRATYYRRAGKLYLSILYRTFDGNIETGKSVVLHEDVIRGNPKFRALLARVFKEWQ